MADQKHYDVRIEAALTKIICSEKALKFLNDAQIIFGGMGYETADSKRERGEPAFGMEQLVRDITMYRIGEGATDILRPFVAREGLNTHLEKIKGSIDQGMKPGEFIRLMKFYVPWYLSQWQKRAIPDRPEFKNYKIRTKLEYVERTSRHLARKIFYAMLLRREAMRDDQGRQDRIDIVGEELFTIVATALHAQTINHPYAWQLADEFFRAGKKQIQQTLKELMHNDDEESQAFGIKALKGEYDSLNQGIIQRGLNDYIDN